MRLCEHFRNISRHKFFAKDLFSGFSSSRHNLPSFKIRSVMQLSHRVYLDKHEWAVELGVYRDIGRLTRGSSLRISGGRPAHADD